MRLVCSSPSACDCDNLVFTRVQRNRKCSDSIIKQLQFSCTYDTTAHDYDFLFSLSYKSSYNSAYDSNYIRKIPQSVSDTKGKTLLSGQNTETKPTTCSPQNQFQISYHFELSDLPTWQVMSLFVKRTTKRYFGVLYLFLS